MKTTRQKKSNKNGILGFLKKSDKKASADSNPKRDSKDELVVIRDVTSNKEYYLSFVDTFVLSKREYVVMYNYVPDDGNHDGPELVIMRTEFGPKGDQLFYSIKDSDELELAFTCFMRRYYNSSTPDKKARYGVGVGNGGSL